MFIPDRNYEESIFLVILSFFFFLFYCLHSVSNMKKERGGDDDDDSIFHNREGKKYKDERPCRSSHLIFHISVKKNN